MKAGNGNLSLTIIAIGLLALVSGLAHDEALAETPTSACAGDSLYLISPDMDSLDLRLQQVGRAGVTISWPDLDQSEATCFALSQTEDLDITVDVDGGYADQVDRNFVFTASNTGTLGSNSPDKLQLDWGNTSDSVNGRVGGQINLANNGGYLRYGHGAGNWQQLNTGLPMVWPQTNIEAAAAGQDGFHVAAFSKGETLGSEMAGLYVYNTGVWSLLGADALSVVSSMTDIAVSPNNNDHFVVGTGKQGVFVTTDGGASFTQWRSELNPGHYSVSGNYNVTAVDWNETTLIVAIAGYGVFYSTDNGTSFAESPLRVLEDLDDPGSDMVVPTIQNFTSDPADSDRLLACLVFHGVYESLDGAQTWTSLGGDLVTPNPGNPGAWEHTALAVGIDATDGQILLAGFRQEGLYRSADGGTTWVEVGQAQQPTNLSELLSIEIVALATQPGTFFIFEDNWSLLRSTDSGLNFEIFNDQPYRSQGTTLLLATDGTEDLLLGSYGGGIFEPGSTLHLSDTMTGGSTDPNLVDVELGLDITLGSSLGTETVTAGDSFYLTCQTFQGWAVWRAPYHDRDNMTLLGLYDRVNPESCIEGYCGDDDFIQLPSCYRAKRASCFNFDDPDTIRFFDADVYNGFVYLYSVTSFDYGNTAESTAESLTKEMLFSARWDGDPNTPFPGGGNRQVMQVNISPEAATGGEEIYVYPNPLRPGAGIPGREGNRVVFTNLPPNSRVRVFTMAGDDVIDLGPDNQIGANIYWGAHNRRSEPVAPGVYIYKVEMPQREPYWGRLVVIR